jgi:hypothetical protein
MLHDAAWQARISCVLSGALRAWDLSGSVSGDPDHAAAFFVSAAGSRVRILHCDPAGWEVSLCDPVSASNLPLGRHAALPGLLRRLREELAPHAAAGRLVIGSQSLS